MLPGFMPLLNAGAGTWHQIAAFFLSITNAGPWNGYTVRNIFAPSVLPLVNGDTWRITLTAGSGNALNITDAWMGVLSGTYGFTAAKGQLKAAGGTTINIAGGQSLVLDNLTIAGSGAAAKANGLNIAFYLTGMGGSANAASFSGNAPGSSEYYITGGASDASTASPTGYVLNGNAPLAIAKIENFY